MWVGGGFVCSTKAATEIIKTGHREKKIYRNKVKIKNKEGTHKGALTEKR